MFFSENYKVSLEKQKSLNLWEAGGGSRRP